MTPQEILIKEMEIISRMDYNQPFDVAINEIYTHTFAGVGKVVISGMGKAGLVGRYLSTTLSSTGTPSIFLHPSEAQHGDLGIIQPNDVFILISNSGKTRELIELKTLAKNLYDHSYKNMIIITGCSDKVNDLFDESIDIVLRTGNPIEMCPLGLTPSSSITAMIIISHIIIFGMMGRLDFSKAEYNKRHHGGYLGQKSK